MVSAAGEAFGLVLGRASIYGDRSAARWVVVGAPRDTGDGAFRTSSELEVEQAFAGAEVDPTRVLRARRDRAWAAALVGWLLCIGPWLVAGLI